MARRIFLHQRPYTFAQTNPPSPFSLAARRRTIHCSGAHTILDTENEGFLRSHGSLIQTIGRAARHLEGSVILYADKMTDSMQRAIDETNRRRTAQEVYNEEHGITPTIVIRSIDNSLAAITNDDTAREATKFATQTVPDTYIANLASDMRETAHKFEFERAAKLRDPVKDLRGKELRLRQCSDT